MKLRGIITLALALACTPVFAQTSPGTSPLSIVKGGTGSSTGPTARTALGVLNSRAEAMTKNLTAFDTVMTLGYTTGGDGGGATFKKIGSSAGFIDSFISTFSIQGGSGCTNGTYGAPSGTRSTTAIIWQKSPNPSIAVGTATVSGNALTAVNITGTPGNAYVVGDVLTAQNPLTGCSVQPTITVTAVTSPQASFIDSAGNRWQYVPHTWPNVLQFGAKGDWNGTDVGATNNFSAIQAAVNFAAYKSSTSFDAGGWWGGKVDVPSGSYMMCGSSYFVLPEGTVLDGGVGSGASMLHLCDAYNPSLNAFTICDPIWGFACINSQYRNISFHSSRSVAVSGGTSMVYSNSLQDFGGLYNVYFFGGQRICFHFEKGYGGSSWIGAEKISCNPSSPNNVGIKIGNTAGSGMNLGSTNVSLRDIVIGGPTSSPYQLQAGMQIFGAFTRVENLHCENINFQCIYIESPASANGELISLVNINSQGCASGGTCTGVVTLGATNDPGNTVFELIPVPGGYSHVIENGQVGGTSLNTRVVKPITCPNTCS